MMQGNEIIALLLTGAVGLFLLQNRRRLQALPSRGILYAAFCVTLGARVLTICEGFVYGDALNLLEHLCYAGSAILLAVWCWRVFAARGEAS